MPGTVPQPPTLNLIGCGRLGKTLARLAQQHQVLSVQDILTTSPASAAQAVAFIGAGRAVAQLDAMRAADLWLLAVPDSQIASMAQALADWAARQPAMAPALALHGSGALAAQVLAPLAAQGWATASAHCLLSFADPAKAVQQFAGVNCALEGDDDALQRLQPILQALGAQCFSLTAEHKMLYHAAAVFATNFLPVLQATAEALWQHSGMHTEQLPALRARLLQMAVDNVLDQGPAGALTGPAARGDRALVQRQEQAVRAWDSDAGAAYAALSALAARLAQAKPR